MNTILIFLICGGSLIFRDSAKRVLFLCLGVSMLMSWVMSFYVVNGILYHALDAIILTCVSEVVRYIKPTTKNNLFIQKVCILGIIADIIGAALWFNYNSPVYYNLISSMIYAMVLYAMMDRWINEPTVIRYGSRISRFNAFAVKGNSPSLVNKS